MRVVFVTNELPPYRRPVFERLGERAGLDMRILVCTRREAHRPWSGAGDLRTVKVQPVGNLSLKLRQKISGDREFESDRLVHIPIGLPWSLLRYNADMIVSGGFGFASIVAWMVARLTGKKLMLWSEEVPEAAQHISPRQRRIRQFLIPRADGWMAWGQRAVDYFVQEGVSRSRVNFCPQAVDNDFWREATALARSKITRAGQRRTVLYVGQLSARKGIKELLAAIALIPPDTLGRLEFLFVGAGPEEATIREHAERLRPAVVNVGAVVPMERLPEYYAQASLVVFPSLIDVWGLVVNEAMAAGIPVVGSSRAGSAELIRDGINGAIVDPLDAAGLARAIQFWVEKGLDPPVPSIQEHIARWSIQQCEADLFQALCRLEAGAAKASES